MATQGDVTSMLMGALSEMGERSTLTLESFTAVTRFIDASVTQEQAKGAIQWAVRNSLLWWDPIESRYVRSAAPAPW